jgi:hypothetical protein
MATERTLAVERQAALTFAGDGRRIGELLRRHPAAPGDTLADRLDRLTGPDRAEAERLIRRLARMPGVIGDQWRAARVIMASRQAG